jgi:DNA polymerase
LLDLNISITKVRGNFFDYKGIKVLPTYQPAYLLRNPNKKGEAWQDLQIVMGELLKK